VGLEAPTALLGIDFTCAPGKTKPITLARGVRLGSVVKLDKVEAIASLDEFLQVMSADHPSAASGWIGGFDFPFGLPRVFVDALMQSPPLGWLAAPMLLNDLNRADSLITALHQHCQTRQGFAALIDDWGQGWGLGTRPPKLPHRRADTALPGVSSTSPLQTRYVPVGKMYFEGLWRLVQAGVALPGLLPAAADQAAPARIALEAYPGLLAQEIIGRQSYKSDARDQQTGDRLMQRLNLIDALEQGRTRLGLRLKLTPAQRDHLASDAQGDRLDAVLCLIQAAWAQQKLAEGDACCGQPPDVDPIEGWILTA
jgi:hypothetical protein